MSENPYLQQMAAYERKMRSAPPGAEFFPSTYQPVTRRPGVEQSGVFDPALKHFARAYRAGEPVFHDAQLADRWRRARRTAMEHVLSAIAASPSAEHLVLRGSTLLRAWLGDAAREPGDLDFVVDPPTMTLDEARAADLFADIITAVRDQHHDGTGIAVDTDDVATETIWTYERAPGRRLVFTWHARDLPPGTVQIDAVFNEYLLEPAVWTDLATGAGTSAIRVRAATPALSLAWKIRWLETDTYPQGKDLYDATLLAEFTTVPWGLLEDTLVKELGSDAYRYTPERVLTWKVDWANLQDEHPWIEGDARSWQQRLASALTRSFPPPVCQGELGMPSST